MLRGPSPSGALQLDDSPRSPRSPTRTGSASRGGSGSGAGSSFLNPLQASRPPVPGPGAADGPPPSLDPAACLGPSDRALGRINLSQRASGSFTGRPPMPPSTLPPSALLGSGSHLGLVLGFGSSAAAGRHGGPEGSGGGATAAVAAGTLMNLPSVTATSACCAASAPSTTSASSGAISGGGSLTSRSWDAAAAAPAAGATARPPPLGTLSESSGAATAPPGSLRRSSAVVGAAAAAALAAADAALAAAAAGAGKGAGAGGGGGRCTGNAALAASLLAALAGRPELLEGTYVWIDIFAVNQHPGKTQADDLARLQEVVGASEGTLLVLDAAGLVLTRIWCLYEIWQTVRRWGPKGLRVLSGTLRRDELAAVWAELDVERAQATLESDRTRILADIRATTGGNELNHHIKRALVESAVAELAEARAAAPRSPRHGAAALKAAALLRTSSASGSAASEALAAAREAAEVLRECGGPTHGDTLEALRAVAGCHSDAGALGLALGLLQQQVLPHLEEAYGPGHVSYDAWYDVGCLQYKMGLYIAAYCSLLTAFVHQLRALAAAAPPTAAPTQDLAAVVAGADGNVVAMSTAVAAPPPLRWDQLAAALAAMRALAAAAREEAAEVAGSAGGTGCALAGSGSGGPLHRSAARAADRVGLTLNMLGLVQVQRARSLPASSGSLTASTSAPSGFSPAGPGLDPAPSRHGLLREARLLMEASVELLEVFGCAGRGVAALDARSNLAGVAMEAGELQSAERLLRANLSLTEAVYGPRHRHTATALNNLAVCLKRQRQRVSDGPDCAGGGPDGSGLLGGGGRRSSSSLGTGGDPRAAEAAALYRRCLALCEGALGEAHPETLVVATNLGVLLAEQHCWSESERLLTRAVAGLPLQAGEGQPNPDALLAHRRLAEVLELRGRLFEAEALYRTALQYAESACPEARDHCLILDCREALGRVGERLEELARRAQNQDVCCVVS
ncbi:hypothetical protein HYH03_015508 [Edaphochlamys debaryana]|uniref:Kinesin light chain n=1 Tax=Edaphochlamys debaryana TaxID=47281 RepID=A0A835XM21_9CHLO|nr:hypothetical protein HYH03_015508 [Edaphochlamys debaryana]|eukprot:KAG2485797.1 hypothetical protein HYH03_015508 [Edaphochlamys debaryana]